MKRCFVAIGYLLALQLAVVCLPAYAMESTSFVLYADELNQAAAAPKQSTNFQVSEDQTTWYALPAQSTSFQIVIEPPVQSSSSSSSSTSSVSSESESNTGGGGGGASGGRRGNSGESGGDTLVNTSGESQPRTDGTIPLLPAAPDRPASTTPLSSDISDDGAVPAKGYFTSPIVQGAVGWDEAAYSDFDRIDELEFCEEEQFHGAAYTPRFFWFQLLAFILCVLFAWFYTHAYKRCTDDGYSMTDARAYAGRNTLRILLAFILLVVLLLRAHQAFAQSSTPLKYVYNAHLLDSSGNAITTQHTIRFSWWSSQDYTSADTTGTGAVNTGQATYAGWQEVHTVTPDSNGHFSVELGSITSLPDLSSYTAAQLQSLYLQVEVKSAANPDTSYELLDVNGADASVDRSAIDAVPFAQNADMVDLRHVGSGSGSIPVLQQGGTLNFSAIPGGTNADAFIIDANNSTGSVTLQFGATLAKTLTYDNADSRFEFNDDVYISGNLTVTGLVNGINLSTLTTLENSHLKVSSGAGLTVNIAGGSYRINGSTTNHSGTSGLSVSDNSTNYVFFTSTGVNISTIGFPTNKSYIPVATVTTSAGTVTTITDARVLQADDRERTMQKVFSPQFPNAALQGDATNNIGRMFLDHDSTTKRNFYHWTSTNTTLQDHDVIMRITLPQQFNGWDSSPFSMQYRSTSANATDNALDIQVFDTNGSPVTLSGTSTGLANTSWSTASLTWGGTPTWTPGEQFTIVFRLYAKNNYQMHLGDFTIQYKEFLH